MLLWVNFQEAANFGRAVIGRLAWRYYQERYQGDIRFRCIYSNQIAVTIPLGLFLVSSVFGFGLGIAGSWLVYQLVSVCFSFQG